MKSVLNYLNFYRASREEMMAAAAAQAQANNSKNAFGTSQQSTNTRANLVQNAAPIAVSGPPAFDSNV